MLYDRDDRMPRLTFLDIYDFDESTEKRARAEGWPWPPWVVIGRRVFYSRARCAEWFAQAEQGITAETVAEVHQPLDEQLDQDIAAAHHEIEHAKQDKELQAESLVVGGDRAP
jgi:hypothetical protein